MTEWKRHCEHIYVRGNLHYTSGDMAQNGLLHSVRNDKKKRQKRYGLLRRFRSSQ